MNVGAQGAGTVVVFAVHVIGDGTAHGDEAGSRRDGEKPSLGKKYVDDIVKSDSAFAADHSRGLVEAENPVETMTLDQIAARVETRITVTPPQAKRKQGVGFRGVENPGYLVIPSWFVDLAMFGPWISTPGKDTLGVERPWMPCAFGQSRGRLRLSFRRAAKGWSRRAHSSATPGRVTSGSYTI